MRHSEYVMPCCLVGSWWYSGEARVRSLGAAESKHQSTEWLQQLQWRSQVQPRWTQTDRKTSNSCNCTFSLLLWPNSSFSMLLVGWQEWHAAFIKIHFNKPQRFLLAESWDMAYILAFQLAVAACLDNEYVSAHLYVCYYYFFAFKFIVTRICIIQCVIKLVVFFYEFTPQWLVQCVFPCWH